MDWYGRRQKRFREINWITLKKSSYIHRSFFYAVCRIKIRFATSNNVSWIRIVSFISTAYTAGLGNSGEQRINSISMALFPHDLDANDPEPPDPLINPDLLLFLNAVLPVDAFPFAIAMHYNNVRLYRPMRDTGTLSRNHLIHFANNRATHTSCIPDPKYIPLSSLCSNFA